MRRKANQKIMRWAVVVLLITLAGFAAPGQAACQRIWASVQDIPVNTIASGTFSPSPAAIRIPKDIADGTELYRMTARINSYIAYRISCNASASNANYYTKGQFVNAAPAISGSSTSGTVYSTGTDGVGMVVLIGSTNKALGAKYAFHGYCSPATGCGTYAEDADITLVLVKTGSITASSIDLSTLPKLEAVIGGENSPGTEFAVFHPQFTGTITFTQATCALAESSKTVDLGTWHIKDFAQAGAATPWVDASIKLINCNYGGAQSYKHNIRRYDNNATVTVVAQPLTTSAAWHLKVTPATSVVNNTTGIMAISTTEPYHASGVGIQLSSSNTSLNAIQFSETRTGTMVSGTNATMTLPLYARYIKTGSTVTAGLANGKVTYLVEYK